MQCASGEYHSASRILQSGTVFYPSIALGAIAQTRCFSMRGQFVRTTAVVVGREKR